MDKYVKKGMIFNQLEVIGDAPRQGGKSRSLCRCIYCGTEKTVRDYYIRTGKTKSCGCTKGGHNKLHLPFGCKIYRLTVISAPIIENDKMVYVWQCECGNIHKAKATDVNRGRVKSCGCLQRERAGRKPSKE